MASPWTGAWQWLHDSFDGRLLLTEKYICAVFGQKDRQPPQAEQPTEAEAAGLFRSMSFPFAGPMKTAEAEGEWIWDMTATVAVHPAMVGTHMRRAHKVEGDRMYGQIVQGDGTRTPPDAYRRLSEPGTSPLAGAWELVSDEWDGMMLMTDTQYRYIVARKDRPHIAARESDLNDADAALLYHSYDAQGGSYTVSGSTMTRRPEVARDPRQQGLKVPIDFRVTGETLTTRRAQEELIWRRLE